MRPALALRGVSGQWIAPAEKNPSLIEPFRFCFLGKEQVLERSSDWNHSGWEKIWLYNLHYFDDLNAEGSSKRKEWHAELIERWIEDNPPGFGNGWEPYPTSLRIVNWVKWVLAGNDLTTKAVESLAVQMRLLEKRIEYHLLGNHLLANAKALVFAGLFFRGEEATRWLKKGIQIFLSQLPEQVLPDGGHFERSPMYHGIILEDLLDLINIQKAYGQEPAKLLNATAQRMLVWLRVMTHPDGEIALFNDAAFGIAPIPSTLFDYAQRLGHRLPEQVNETLTNLEASGYIRMQTKIAVALLDVAPIGPDYLPGHAHADTLSFELSLFGQRVIVDSGTSCYGDSPERLRQRGSVAHNTVMIDGLDSSEVWSGFRVARRARPFGLKVGTTKGATSVRCSHDGYWRLLGRPTHRREWVFDEKRITIKDCVDGPFTKAIERLHLHPNVSVHIEDDALKGSLVLQNGQHVCWQVEGGSAEVVDTTYHPEFGLSIPNKCIEVIFAGSESKVIFSWG